MISRTVAALAVLAASVSGLPPATAAQEQTVPRTVAVTIDDLPAVRFTTLADARAMTSRLLEAMARHGILATGFVNESKLDAVPAERAGRSALLEAWLEAGHDLGNHTYSHLRLYGTTLAAFEADLLRGERVTRRLLEARGRTPRYFRHPTLNTGADRDTREGSERILAAHGYTVAPVTIDNDEYVYAAAYDRARARGDSTLMTRLGADYLRYMEAIFAYHERLSRTLLGRELSQVLLLHANWLNADFLEALAESMVLRGYRFVTLAEALQDPAYRLPDDYIGPRGPSWLERWLVTRGQAVEPAPPVPGWVQQLAR